MAAGSSEGVATSTIVAVAVVATSVIAISHLSDWESVEISFRGFKMKRKAK